MRPLGLSKKFMKAQGKTKLDDGAALHPYLNKMNIFEDQKVSNLNQYVQDYGKTKP